MDGVIGDIVTVAPILREKLDDSLSIASDQELVLPGGSITKSKMEKKHCNSYAQALTELSTMVSLPCGKRLAFSEKHGHN